MPSLMFPSRLRKSPESLNDLSKKTIHRFLIESSHFETTSFNRNIQCLPSQLQTSLLDDVIPSDIWKFPCLRSQERIHCKIHSECEMLYSKCPTLLSLYFKETVSSLTLDFRRIRLDDHETVLSLLCTFLSRCPHVQLSYLSLKGGTVQTDSLIRSIEKLVSLLVKSTPNLRDLRLFIGTNVVCKYLALLPNLTSLFIERTQYFNRKGLSYLCDSNSRTRYHLTQLTLGVFKHRFCKKLDASKFFLSMKALKSFSLRDEKRSCTQNSRGRDKVGISTYSVIKLAMMTSLDLKYGGGGEGEEDSCHWTSYLSRLQIVDRVLKAKYLISSCPHLKDLSLDWTENTCFSKQIDALWFSKLIWSSEWSTLSSSLRKLKLRFPSFYNRTHYSCHLSDFIRLSQTLSNLFEVKLQGAGSIDAPLPLSILLASTPVLHTLILTKTRIYIPEDSKSFIVIHGSLRVFEYEGVMNDVESRLLSFIASSFPILEDCSLEAISGTFPGWTPESLSTLSSLQNLRRLSLPLSYKDSIMNLPSVILSLKDFQVLRILILSWGRYSFDISHGKILYSMNWLFEALKAENAIIEVFLSYKMHSEYYLRS